MNPSVQSLVWGPRLLLPALRLRIPVNALAASLTPLLLAALSVGCEPITVDPTDTTPPTFTLQVASPRTAVGVVYADTNEEVSGALDPARAFVLDPANTSRPITFMLVARDPESAIWDANLDVDLSYVCGSGIPGFPETRESGSTFREITTTPLPPNDEDLPSRIVVVSFTLNDLWRPCRNWSGFVRNSGDIAQVTGTIRATARNNADPWGRGDEEWSFTLARWGYRVALP